MEVGRKAEESHPKREVASLLEKCLCPPGTAGFSCQVGRLWLKYISWFGVEICVLQQLRVMKRTVCIYYVIFPF